MHGNMREAGELSTLLCHESLPYFNDLSHHGREVALSIDYASSPTLLMPCAYKKANTTYQMRGDRRRSRLCMNQSAQDIRDSGNIHVIAPESLTGSSLRNIRF